MNKVDRPGTGEQCCRSSAQVRTLLVNEPIIEQDAEFFCLFVGAEVTIQWANEARCLYGTAKTKKDIIRLNRHCVGTFLHELAHILTWKALKDRGHGYNFGLILDQLIIKWYEYTNAKKEVLNGK